MAIETLRPNAHGDETSLSGQIPIEDRFTIFTEYSVGEICRPYIYFDGRLDYECTTAGTSANTEPIWNETIGGTTSSGTVVFTTRSIHWDKVDEAVADDDTTYVKNELTTLAYERDLYNLPASSGSGTINKITVYFRCKTAANITGHMKASIKSGTTVADGAEKTVTSEAVWETFSQEWAENPDTETAWAWGDIDALQIGVSLYSIVGKSKSLAYCTQVYVEVDYTPSAAVPRHAFINFQGPGIF